MLKADNNELNVLIVDSGKSKEFIQEQDKCDKFDYLIAVACGAVGGLIDVFFVGTPKNSSLLSFSDAQVDNMVKGFAKMIGWAPNQEKSDNIASAIGYLERKYKVNYDQRYSSDVDSMLEMSTKNHHMKSLAHSPDIIGLFFSIINQFTSTSSFISDGQLIIVDSETFELQGSNFISKIFCGVANWFGHIMSDVAGSSGSRGTDGRGSGIVIPFYELFGFCDFGNFKAGKDRQDLATIATRAFQEGYDFRFGLAMSIPVVITDLLIRLIWGLRRHFQYGKDIKYCIPTNGHADLRIMLIFGNGTLCIIDGIDAAARSKGDFLLFFMRLNIIAWFRLVILVAKEIYIRIGIESWLQESLESYKRINAALSAYLKELENIDLERFRKETEEYNKLMDGFNAVNTEDALNKLLLDIYDKTNIEKPWKGDFDEYMSDKNGTLIFS